MRAEKTRAHAGAFMVQLSLTIYQQCVLRIADGLSGKMEVTDNSGNFVDSLDKRLFWDVNIADIDEERHKRFIIQRVLERGGLEDIRNTVKHYGLASFTSEAQQIRSLDPITLSFASCLCGIGKDTFKCYIWNP